MEDLIIYTNLKTVRKIRPKKLFINKNISVNNLPNSIIYLMFWKYYNKPVNNLPKSIKKLTFGANFNQPVDNLPNSITHLSFGDDFDQPVDNLPNSITHLKFGHYFQQPLTNLPIWTEKIYLHSCYENKIKIPFGCKVKERFCNFYPCDDMRLLGIPNNFST
jgi:hypothetical protein